MRSITPNVLYDPSIRTDYEKGGGRKRASWKPAIYIFQDNSDWAIIPTHRARACHDPFYMREGLPDAVAREFLQDDILTDSGYALVYKRVIGFHAQNGAFYRSHMPDHVTARRDEIWGDYYYAGLYCSIIHALQNGCTRIAYFLTFGVFAKWQWASFIRAAHNAASALGSKMPLHICENCVQGLPGYSRDEEQQTISPHVNVEHVMFAKHNDDIDLISFRPVSYGK